MTIKPLINQKNAKEENAEKEINLPTQREKRAGYDERHKRSPHKSCGRHKRHDLKRSEIRSDRTDKSSVVTSPTVKPCSNATQLINPSGGKSPKNTSQYLLGANSSPVAISSSASTNNNGVNLGVSSACSQGSGNSGNVIEMLEEAFSGYNSGDEHMGQKESVLTPDQWEKRDKAFSKALTERGLILKDMVEDGACLFRAISIQLYGDQEMHESIRQQTMDYIHQNREYFAQFVTEDIDNYVLRKRACNSHGNHIEIQAMSEMYNRPVELYCYEMEPINIYNSEQINNGYAPLRLSYQRCSHYNAIIDPYNASVGVGLGLAGYSPSENDRKQMHEAVRMSEDLEIEQTMFEDKLKTTDWDATNEAIEEQIARESYLQWARENMNKNSQKNPKSTSTITSTEATSSTSPEKSPKSNTSESLLQHLHFDALRKSASPTSNMLHQSGASGSPSKASPLRDPMEATSPTSGDSPMSFHRRKRRQKSEEKRRLEDPSSPVSDSGSKKVRLSPCRYQRISDDERSIPSPTPAAGGHKIPTSPKAVAEDSPSTSQVKTPEKPLSEFYQSLLESSLTFDGYAQMNEEDMIRKALTESAMDYIKGIERKPRGGGGGTTDDDD